MCCPTCPICPQRVGLAASCSSGGVELPCSAAAVGHFITPGIRPPPAAQTPVLVQREQDVGARRAVPDTRSPREELANRWSDNGGVTATSPWSASELPAELACCHQTLCMGQQVSPTALDRHAFGHSEVHLPQAMAADAADAGPSQEGSSFDSHDMGPSSSSMGGFSMHHLQRGRMGGPGLDSGIPKHQREYTSDSGMCALHHTSRRPGRSLSGLPPANLWLPRMELAGGSGRHRSPDGY